MKNIKLHSIKLEEGISIEYKKNKNYDEEIGIGWNLKNLKNDKVKDKFNWEWEIKWIFSNPNENDLINRGNEAALRSHFDYLLKEISNGKYKTNESEIEKIKENKEVMDNLWLEKMNSKN